MFVPEPPDLDQYVLNRQAAIQLGKALFWDMQVGSDGVVACGTCHFHSGVDGRTTNTVSPGPDGLFQAATPNQQVTAANYPFHERDLPDFQNSTVTRDWDDITGSQGVRNTTFVDIVPGQAAELTTPVNDPVFQVGGVNIRRVTTRQAASVINAAYNFDNTWDGSANNVFNGVNPHGATDPNAKVILDTPAGLEPVQVRIRYAGLASQAVGPPMNGNEMSAAGRTFPKLGKKMLTLTPLAQQLVDPTDSVLGPLVPGGGQRGLNTSYSAMIQAAFQPKWWANTTEIVTYAGGVPSISPHPGGVLTTDQYTQMEANFSLIFGLAVQLYQSTLISDNTPYDQVLEGTRAFTPSEAAGNLQFTLDCAICHGGSEFTAAAHSTVAFGQGGPPPLITMTFNSMNIDANYDEGFFNIGVTRTTDDIGRGGLDPFGRPLSYTLLSVQKQNGLLPNHYDPFIFDLPTLIVPDLVPRTDGLFKAPGLRNIELTAPYNHNGGVGTLEQVVEFYTRGGNHPVENLTDLDPNIIELTDMQNKPEIRGNLVAFMKMLTDERVRFERAPFDHPELIVPIQADPGNPSQDLMQTIPAVGAAGRATPLLPLIGSSSPPVAGVDIATVPYGCQNVVLNVLLNDGDPDGQPLTITGADASSLRGGTVAVNPGGYSVRYTAPVGMDGNDSFNYTVSDGTLTSVGTVHLNVQQLIMVNNAPTANYDLLPIVQANGTDVEVPVLLNDLDIDDNPIFIVSVTNSPDGTSKVNPYGDQIMFTPNAGFAGYTEITYTISDGVLQSSAKALLKVNAYPVANPDTYTVRAGSVDNKLYVLDNDTDANPDDANVLSLLAYDPLYKGTATIDGTLTYISYTPLPGATGTERFSYFVGDLNVADSATVTINIVANSAPALGSDLFMIASNSTNNALNVLVNDADADGDPITILSVAGATHGQVSIAAGNILRYTPNPGYHGYDTFFYTVTDGNNGISNAQVTVGVGMDYTIYLPVLGDR